MGNSIYRKATLKKEKKPDVHVICKREEEIIENE